MNPSVGARLRPSGPQTPSESHDRITSCSEVAQPPAWLLSGRHCVIPREAAESIWVELVADQVDSATAALLRAE